MKYPVNTPQHTRKLKNKMFALICKCTVFLMLTTKTFSVPLPEPSIQQIYLHPETFEDNYCNVTPKDVGAFKYFCVHDYASSIVNQYIDIFAVSDNEQNVNIITYMYASRMQIHSHLRITLMMLHPYARNMLILKHINICCISSLAINIKVAQIYQILLSY